MSVTHVIGMLQVRKTKPLAIVNCNPAPRLWPGNRRRLRRPPYGLGGCQATVAGGSRGTANAVS